MNRKELTKLLKKIIPVFRVARGHDADDDRMWKLVDTLTDSIEAAAGDQDGWLNYFLWDCRCGDEPMKIRPGHGGKPFKLKTAKQLAKLMIPKAP